MVKDRLGDVEFNISLHIVKFLLKFFIFPIVPTLVRGLEGVNGNEVGIMIVIKSE